MDDFDDELRVMQRVQGLLEGLPSKDARRRVATWVFSRFAEDEPGRHSPASMGPGQATKSLKEFVERAAPASKSERLLVLLQWAENHGEAAPSVGRLNEMNREAGGDVFSDAAAIAQSLISSGALERPAPGHLRLSRTAAAATPVKRQAPQGPRSEGLPGADAWLMDLIRRGVIHPEEKIEWARPTVGQLFTAFITPDGQVRSADGRLFNSVSGAACQLAGGSYNGWICWRVPRLGGVTLSELRR